MNPPNYFVDASVFAYALGDEHPERLASQGVVQDAAAGRIVLHASVVMVQELLHHRMRRTDGDTALRQARAASELCVLHPFDASVLARALELVATSPLQGRDAVHAATALLQGLPTLLSSDADFDVAPGITRLAPGAQRQT